MSVAIEVDSLQAGLVQILRHLTANNALQSSPRGLPTREVLGATMVLTDPRHRLVVRPTRKPWSMPFAMGEFLWYMSGSNSLDVMLAYAPQLRRMSDDGQTLNSAYGLRIFGGHPDIGFDQWQEAHRLLTTDRDTRQAILQIRTPRDSLVVTKDHPCTIALQFLRRAGRLHMVVTMRSNDIILGTPYDIFSFTMMQEYMAQELGLELGSYIHQVGSWHLYEHDLLLAQEMEAIGAQTLPMPPIRGSIDYMLEDVLSIREGNPVRARGDDWDDWRAILHAFHSKQPIDLGLVGEPYRLPLANSRGISIA